MDSKLKELRTRAGLSQSKVAELLGIKRQSYFNWEKGSTKPSTSNLKRLAEIFNVSESYFYEDDITVLYGKLNPTNQTKAVRYVRNLVTEQDNIISLAQERRVEYHVYERMSAGVGAAIYGDRDYDIVYYDEELAHDFASWVSGDSMEPTYLDGSVALIRETGFDYDGAVHAVVWNEQTYIKKVYREEDGLRLVSINKKYPDRFAPFDENPRVVGKIVGNFVPLED